MAERIGKYEVVELIARGGMGLIFKARDPILDRLVALKVLSGLEVTLELRARFFREAQACARLSHPNIVTIHDMGEDDGRLFIVMELLEGEDLRQLIARPAPLALEDKLSIMLQICAGLHYAHQRGVVHRDIKPANILLLGTGQVKILDFGIAQIAAGQQRELTRAGIIMGTPRYMAPEQVRGRADHRSDIFSVGAVSYELLSGRPPFTGENALEVLEQLRTATPPRLAEVDPSVPPELAAVVERAMRKEPEDRFADLGQMRGQLDRVQRAVAVEAERVFARVNQRRENLAALHQALAERIGCTLPGDLIPALPSGEPRRLTTLQMLEQEIVDRIQATQSQLARADALAPALQHARQLLANGQLAQSARELEAIVNTMPEHAHAIAALSEARRRLALAADATAEVPGEQWEAKPASPAGRRAQTEAAAGQPSRPGPMPTELMEADATRTWVSRARPLAIGAGIAAAIVVASLLWWAPAPTRRSADDRPRTTESSVGAPRLETVDESPNRVDHVRDAARDAPAQPRDEAREPTSAPSGSEARDTEDQAMEAASPTTAAASPPTSTLAPSVGRREPPSLPAREDDKAASASARLTGTPAGLEQARSRMVAARRGAERVGAGFFAHTRFTSAQRTEREALAALERSDHTAAMRLFGEAQAEYEVAAQEAKQEEERDRQLAPLKASLQQAHAAVTARRDQALAAQAEQLSTDIFLQAESRQLEGDKLVRRQDLVAAARAYRDAAERYGEAILRARAARAQ